MPVQVRRYLLGPASNLQAGPAKYRTTTARGMSKNWGSAAVQFRVIPNARMWHRLAALAACACACVCVGGMVRHRSRVDGPMDHERPTSPHMCQMHHLGNCKRMGQEVWDKLCVQQT